MCDAQKVSRTFTRAAAVSLNFLVGSEYTLLSRSQLATTVSGSQRIHTKKQILV